MEILLLSSAAFSFLQTVCSETHRQSGRCGGCSCRMTCCVLLTSPSSPESPPPPAAAPLIPHRAGCWEKMIHSRLHHDIPTKITESAEETTTGLIRLGCSISAQHARAEPPAGRMRNSELWPHNQGGLAQQTFTSWVLSHKLWSWMTGEIIMSGFYVVASSSSPADELVLTDFTVFSQTEAGEVVSVTLQVI